MSVWGLGIGSMKNECMGIGSMENGCTGLGV